ncbi:lytic transglycosylase domain-containing protein [Ciceribacter ferrooxidans]|uniref:Lytic transglycosylase domain-containing protein n=1 Tax=Ciceribacter ferrooxidans TaxID=2509717 RepID=A0A4Q2T0Z9_9HYPH|nr:lytic transglycosylase domain-containing protein [Ciceribacter ferrooxidans]RYC12072.1 lytic transglycosylase domain-containing protein [Ciceribacter ferrooxidans]
MISRLDRKTPLGLATLLLAGIAGCTSSMDQAAKQELKANPAAGTPVAQTAAATPATAESNAAVISTAGAEPGPIIPGTSTPAPVPTFKAIALANPAATPAALAMATGQEQLAMQTAAMPAKPDAVPELASAETVLPAEVTAIQTVVPTQKPAGALAYAAPSASSSLAALDAQFDISPPGAPPVVEKETVPQAAKGPTVINALISKYAAVYKIPEALLHRVVRRESTYNPQAYNNGHYGLMQIKYNTAKSMGYEGPASGLFDAETNIKYAAKYLRGAWLVADNSNDGAVRLYARGYYYDAKRKGMLDVLE